MTEPSPFRAAGAARRRALGVLVLFLAVGLPALAQATAAPGGDDLDQLFDSGATVPPALPDKGPGATAPVRPEDLTRDDKMHFFGTWSAYANLGPGWSNWPNPDYPKRYFGIDGGASLTAGLGVEVRPAPQLRLRALATYNFPTTGIQVSELIIDYTLRNTVFFRAGIFGYTWGDAQFSQLGNLPGRTLPTWTTNTIPVWQQTNLLTNTTTSTLPTAVKAYIPLGRNGLTFYVRADPNYFETRTEPDLKSAGYGLMYDQVTGPIEWSLGGYYERLLTPRSMLMARSTVFGCALSVEGVMAFPVTYKSTGFEAIPTSGGGLYIGGLMKRVYPDLIVGLSREWPALDLKLHAEYTYNSERDPHGDQANPNWLEDAVGPGGNATDVALHLGHFLHNRKLGLNLLWQHNWSTYAGLTAAFLELAPDSLFTVQIGAETIYGRDIAEVSANRLLPENNRFGFVILARLNTSFKD
ncbi:MAG TPA: hypothetical protein VFL04_02995 [Rectinemataceae bacterium]|nr:hypothetical protein [Rectinemataceae bacterium]